MKKIVVACGSGIATSTAVEAKVKDLLDNNGLSGQYTITKCAIGEAPSKCADADLLVATTAAPAGISCPYVSGVPFLTTIGARREPTPAALWAKPLPPAAGRFHVHSFMGETWECPGSFSVRER